MTTQELINLWHEFYAILAQGRPPLGLLLLAFNGTVLFFWISRKTSKPQAHATRSETAILTQLLFLSANLLLIFKDDILRYLPYMPDLTRLI